MPIVLTIYSSDVGDLSVVDLPGLIQRAETGGEEPVNLLSLKKFIIIKSTFVQIIILKNTNQGHILVSIKKTQTNFLILLNDFSKSTSIISYNNIL